MDLNFRQVHLDFHTSPKIPEIGEAFDPEKFAETYQQASVETVNLFAKCHHGYSYFDSAVGVKHPNMAKPLLEQQVAALHAVGIETQIYLSVAWDELVRRRHPEWRQMKPDGSFYQFPSPGLTPSEQPDDVWQPAWASLCLNSDYLDYLVAHIEEVVDRFPETAGIWLDIVHQFECCCYKCQDDMTANGLDWMNSEDRKTFGRSVLENYYSRTYNAVKAKAPNMRVVHNQGLPRGDHWRFDYFSHYELESLPTGGWGYDHFPFCVRYLEKIGLPYLGMTGKFHTTWGEFGGYKHLNALRYECASMLAYGARICIGDQLHPSGCQEASTYALIGEAYREVAEKEAWCGNTRNIADVAVLSSLAVKSPGASSSKHGAANEDDGVGRMLLESHILFDVIDQHMDFSPYKLIILPDLVRLSNALAEKLQNYRTQGGKLLLSYESGLSADSDEFALHVGAQLKSIGVMNTSFTQVKSEFPLRGVSDPFLVRGGSTRVTVDSANVLAELVDPYFLRSATHFCGHQHAPAKPEVSGYPSALEADNTIYLSHPVFSEYAVYGTVVLKEYVINAVRRLLGDQERLRLGNFPSTARVTLREKRDSGNQILHLLYANTVLRGMTAIGPIQVVEDLPELHSIGVQIRCPREVVSVTLQPQNKPLRFTQQGNILRFEVARFECHQMVEICHAEGVEP